MKKITAKYRSICAETGKVIWKGDSMYYSYITKKCYHMDSSTAKSEKMNSDDADLVAAQENAYFDNFCLNNKI